MSNIECAKCNTPLENDKVTISYMGSSFPVELLKCPKCNLVYIPESLALGKMLQVEKTLEDK
jgi:phage FluMu protein Com